MGEACGFCGWKGRHREGCLAGAPALEMEPRIPHFVKESATSRDAAVSSYNVAIGDRAAVWAYIQRRGALGATDDEVELHLEMRHQTASARRAELRDAGFITDSGERRKTRSGRRAVVWVDTKHAKPTNKEDST